jgi:hypothetical protein
MFTFLRKVRRNLIETSKMKKYSLYAIGEIALVVIGILIALQINNWNEQKKQRVTESQYMLSLLSDLEKDKNDLEESARFGGIPVMYNDSLFAELQKAPIKGNEKRIYHFLMLYTNGIEVSYHDRTISQLKNSGGFGLIQDQAISDAVLDYDVHMKESMSYNESIYSNHHINHDISLNRRIYELYRVEHLKDSAIVHKEDINKVAYPDDLKLLSYEVTDIKLLLNSMSAVRVIDNHKYQRALKALEMNRKLDSLIRRKYQDIE